MNYFSVIDCLKSQILNRRFLKKSDIEEDSRPSAWAVFETH